MNPLQFALRLLRRGNRCLAVLALTVLLTPTPDCPAAEEAETSAEDVRARVDRLIEELGHRDYHIRQQAQAELVKLSYRAFDALSIATRHENLEVASRAAFLLRSMQVDWSKADDPAEVRENLADYEAQNMPTKLVRVRALAALPDGTGVAALCRLIRYEKSMLMSKHAALELIENFPQDDPPAAELNGRVRQDLLGSDRPGPAWLSAWLSPAEEPDAVVADWAKLVDAENALLIAAPGQTSSNVVARLVRLQIRVLRDLDRDALAVAAMQRLLELEKGNLETLAELFAWLGERKEFDAADELAAKHTSRLAEKPIMLYDLAAAEAEHGDRDRAERTVALALLLNPGPTSAQLTRHRTVAQELRARGQLDWAGREYRHIVETGTAGDAIVASTLGEWLDWLVDRQAWQEADELAERYAAKFAGDPMLLYTHARAQAGAGKTQQAETTAQRALELNPGEEPAALQRHLAVARTLRTRGWTKWAMREYRHAFETGAADSPLVTVTLIELLEFMVEQTMWEEVDELAAAVTPRFADHAVLHYTLAQAQRERGQTEQAEQTAEKALAFRPGKASADVNAHRMTARVLWRRRLFDWAVREYRQVVDRGMDDVETLGELVECLIAQKAFAEVDALAGRFAMRFAGNPMLLYAHAQALAESGNRQRADEIAAKAQLLNPGNDSRSLNEHRLTAGRLRDRGLFAWAKREYRQVIDSGSPDFVVRMAAQSSLMEMLHDQGDDFNAAEEARKLTVFVETRPDMAGLIRLEASAVRSRAHFFRACHWQSVGEAEKCRTSLNQAIQADSGDLDVLIACYQLPGQNPRQRKETLRLIQAETASLRQQIAEEPDDASPYNQFAWLVGNTEGDFDEALRYSKRSIQLRPGFGGYHDTLAHVYFGKGDYENAVKTQTKAAELDPHSGLIRKKLELFREKLEQQQQAPAGEGKEPEDAKRDGSP